MEFNVAQYIESRIGSTDRIKSSDVFDLMDAACQHYRKVGRFIAKALPHLADEVRSCIKELSAPSV